MGVCTASEWEREACKLPDMPSRKQSLRRYTTCSSQHRYLSPAISGLFIFKAAFICSFSCRCLVLRCCKSGRLRKMMASSEDVFNPLSRLHNFVDCHPIDWVQRPNGLVLQPLDFSLSPVCYVFLLRCFGIGDFSFCSAFSTCFLSFPSQRRTSSSGFQMPCSEPNQTISKSALTALPPPFQLLYIRWYPLKPGEHKFLDWIPK